MTDLRSFINMLAKLKTDFKIHNIKSGRVTINWTEVPTAKTVVQVFNDPDGDSDNTSEWYFDNSGNLIATGSSINNRS